MTTKTLTINKYIRRNDKQLHKLVKHAINNNEKIHISAPTGTGKTQFIIEIVNRYGSDYQILILEPQIAIMNQVQHELKQRGIKPFIYHHDTKKKFSQEHLKNPILSTYDSAHNLINKLFTDHDGISPQDFNLLDPSKTIVIMDETHVLIQDGKSDYDKSIRAIIDADVPIIGFSATPSAWVTAKLLDMDTCVEISSSSIPKKKILPIQIKRSIAGTLADYIVNNKKYKKVVIYTTDIKMQNKIKDEILSLDNLKNILILNRPERMKRSKKEWNYLMKNGVLPKHVNILIMNKVAQAGINIKDKNIDAVFLVGQFEPYGFIQYLGRTRNYVGPYFFIYNNYGTFKTQEEDIPTEYANSALIESILNNAQLLLDNISTNDKFDTRSLISTFGEKYNQDENGDLSLNKCVIAKDEYDQYGKLHGLSLVRMVEEMDSNIEANFYDEIEPVISKVNINKKRRDNIKAGIPKLIEDTASELSLLMRYLTFGSISLDDLLYIINNSESKRVAAARRQVPFIKAAKKILLVKLISSAKEVGYGVPKLIAVAKSYLLNGNDPTAISKILSKKVSNYKIVNALKAKLFFSSGKGKNNTITNILDKMDKHVGSQYQKPIWITAIKKAVGNIPGSDEFAEIIYNLFCVFEDHHETIGGKKMKVKRLIKIVRTHNQYVKETGIDIF